jgi:hypothetical protein
VLSNSQNYICTATGGFFNFDEPEQNVFNIRDIAHALSRICRFTGHTSRHYSVAQHSVMVSHIVPPKFALQGLMHDGSEAYLGDVSSPLKRLLPDYRRIEKRVEAALFSAFGLPDQLDESVKKADMILLATERRDFMPVTWDKWECLTGVQPLEKKIIPWSNDGAKLAFLTRFEELISGKA